MTARLEIARNRENSMIVGSSLFRLDGNAYFSPEFPRGGLAATFAVDVTDISGSPTVAIHIQHRNSEDTTFTSLVSFAAITAVGAFSKDATGVKEIVRFQYDFDAADQATDAIQAVAEGPVANAECQDER